MSISRDFVIYPSMDVVRTDGERIWYNDLVIGWTRASGRKALLDYTSRSGHFISLKVSRAVRGLERLSERYCLSMIMFRPEGEICASSGLPRRRIRMTSPLTRVVKMHDGRRLLRNERSGDALGW